MSFFYNVAKKEKPAKPKLRLADIPVKTLQGLGCSVCPRNDDSKLVSPKLKPSGRPGSQFYLLGGSPSQEDDENNNHWTDKVGRLIYDKMGPAFMESEVRSGYITQCEGPQTAVEIECCRGRVAADIEATKPLLIIGIGDAVMRWLVPDVSNKTTALTHRGSFFVVKVGNHTCWFMPILYPNFVHKKSTRKDIYEIVMEQDIRAAKSFVRALEFRPAKFYANDYAAGVDIITGQEPGDMQRLERALARVLAMRRHSLDIETNGLRPFMLKEANIWEMAVGSFEYTVAFAVDHPDGWGTQAQRRRVWQLIAHYFVEAGQKCCHNLALEMEWFAFFFGGGMLRQTEWDDTMAMAHTLDERPGTKGLGHQTLMHFGFDVKKQSNIDVTRLLDYPIRDTLRYNGMDTKWTDKLRDHLEPMIDALPAYRAEYDRKVRLAPTLVLTEIKGMPVDFKYAADMKAELEKRLVAIEAKINRCSEILDYKQRFGTFSATNSDHVLKLMKEVLKRPEVRVEDKRTGAVSWTTGEEVLAAMPARDVPSAALILEHRGLAKLTGTYLQPIIDRKIVCPDGIIRCKYSSMTAVTGRLASEDPNFQNFPKRKNKEVRGVIAAPPGFWIVPADYGQLEFRVVGMASEDKNVVKYCWTGYDVHKYWAQRMVDVYPSIKDQIVAEFGVDWDEKGLKTLRQEAKNKWVFPQLFGASTQSCANNLKLPDWAAEDLGAEFWDEFAGVKTWQDKLLDRYAKNGYVETLGGRRERQTLRKEQIINMPIQGTGCDIVTEAMNAISERAQVEEDPHLQPGINVHDDLTFMLPDEGLEQRLDIISHEMCKVRFDYINVPLLVEVSMGSRWHDLTEIKVYRSNEIFGHANPYM